MADAPQERRDGVRVPLLTDDPFGAEEAATALEDRGATLVVPFGRLDEREIERSEAIVAFEGESGIAPPVSAYIDRARTVGVPSFVLEPGALDPEILTALAFAVARPSAIAPTAPAEAPPAVEIIAAQGGQPEEGEEPEEEQENLAPGTALETRRLWRRALTVVAATGVLWLVFSGSRQFSGQPDAVAPGTPAPGPGSGGAGGPGGQAAGTAVPAGRVTRNDTQGSIGGATVVATGPSRPIATITDGQGRWRFTALRGGTYVDMSTLPRFVAQQVQVDVPEGKAIENVNLSLDPEGS